MTKNNIIVKPEKVGLLRFDIDHYQRHNKLLETGTPPQ